MAGRDLDVVVFGATGITGRQVAAYLARRDGASERWAAAARDPGKVERELADLGVAAPETLVADAADPGSLAAMAERARVVLNLVGPYTVHGRPVIDACIAAGAHYVDLTGEIPFVRRTIDECHEVAAEAGVKVVQVCGFEALPPDLLVALAAETARERLGEGLAEADLELRARPPAGVPRPADLLSGGTLRSLPEIAAAEGSGAITDPAVLVDDPVLAAEVRRRSPIAIAPRRGSGGAVIAPMAPMAFINPAVIHRTAALLAAESQVPAAPFAYREGLALGGSEATLPLRFAAAGAMSAGQAATRALARSQPAVRRRARAVLERVLPASGFGPRGERLEAWSWSMSLRARTTGGGEVRTEVAGEGHPGYLTTATMLAEAGLMLAADDLTPPRAGCLTPAAALGVAHLDRFEPAGVRFRVGEP